jgi:catechol 2,3-dioxygenase-like lactoylglutathione lyase family enzyme
MLANLKLHPVLAAVDIERARRWYAEKLDLHPIKDNQGELIYEVAGERFLMYETPSAGTAKNTVAGWDVDDLDAVMADLRQRGVVFEEYDYPEFKTVNGVVNFGDSRGAWFKDSEGNIFSLNESRESR